jgi:hypothetical protein
MWFSKSPMEIPPYALYGEIGPFHPEMTQFPMGKHHNECIKRSKYLMVPIGIQGEKGGTLWSRGSTVWQTRGVEPPRLS